MAHFKRNVSTNTYYDQPRHNNAKSFRGRALHSLPHTTAYKLPHFFSASETSTEEIMFFATLDVMQDSFTFTTGIQQINSFLSIIWNTDISNSLQMSYKEI
jgi:hypothetical protein